jgi:Fe(3+) dicitrate transport protein
MEKLETGSGVTNFTNSYFTRRATGYPGPGIIPRHKDILYYTRVYIFKGSKKS